MMKYTFFLILLFATTANAQDVRPSIGLAIKHKNAEGGNMPAAVFRLASALMLPANEPNRDDFYIQCFDVSIIRKDEVISPYTNKGAKFDTKLLDLVTNAKSGDVFIFDEFKIRCKGTDCFRKFFDLTFRIE